MVNPFEETAQAARDWDWNPREAFISSQGVDQSIQGLIRDHKNKQQYWEDLGGSDSYPSINSNRSPTNRSPYNPSWMEAGITNPNLNGYKVMNAKGSKWSPRYWWQRGSDWEHGTNLAEEYLMGEKEMAHANREFNKFQIRANEPDARDQQLWLYNQAREENKQPLFFDTIPAPDDPYEDWIHKMQYFDVPDTMEAKINLQDIFRNYPDINIWRLIQNLDARGIEYANRGGIIGLL